MIPRDADDEVRPGPPAPDPQRPVRVTGSELEDLEAAEGAHVCGSPTYHGRPPGPYRRRKPPADPPPDDRAPLPPAARQPWMDDPAKLPKRPPGGNPPGPQETPPARPRRP